MLPKLQRVFLPADAVNARQECAKKMYLNSALIKKNYHKSTYISSEDAMLTQKDVRTEKLIRTWDLEDNNRETNDVLAKRDLPSHILIYQNLVKNGYSAAFTLIPLLTFQLRTQHWYR